MAGQNNLKRRNLLGVMIFLFTLSACSPKSSPPENTAPTGSIPVTVIDFRELDGCTFLLQMENGDKLQPDNLPLPFQKAGIKLLITYKYNDGMGICMSGRMITLIDVVESKQTKP